LRANAEKLIREKEPDKLAKFKKLLAISRCHLAMASELDAISTRLRRAAVKQARQIGPEWMKAFKGFPGHKKSN